MNHVIDDLEGFMKRLYELSAARKELQKRTKTKKKKSDRKQEMKSLHIILTYTM